MNSDISLFSRDSREWNVLNHRIPILLLCVAALSLCGCWSVDYSKDQIAAAKRIKVLLEDGESLFTQARNEYGEATRENRDYEMAPLITDLKVAAGYFHEACQLSPVSEKPRAYYINTLKLIGLLNITEVASINDDIEKINAGGRTPSKRLIERRDNAFEDATHHYKLALGEISYYLTSIQGRFPSKYIYNWQAECHARLGNWGAAVYSLRNQLKAWGRPPYMTEDEVKRLETEILIFEEKQLKEDEEALDAG